MGNDIKRKNRGNISTIQLTDVTFYAAGNFSNGAALVQAFLPAYGYAAYLPAGINVQVIHHAAHNETLQHNNIRHIFFKGRNGFSYIPFKTLGYIKQQQPHIVLVQGLGFPVQVIMLRLWLGSKAIIVAQHHAERPYRGIKRWFQQVADKCINAYLFTAGKNAEEWFNERIITNAAKYHQLLELSTYFMPVNKQQARAALGMGDADIFLWVGRLEANKDPLTVLRGFEKYVAVNNNAVLYMVYQKDNLLAEVKAILQANPALQQKVVLAGKKNRDELPAWFSAADYYLSGSHREGSGTALIEAMACGCIPVVTNIAAFNAITYDGLFGLRYTAGDADSLFTSLCTLPSINKHEMKAGILKHFEEELSFKAIANRLSSICTKLLEKKNNASYTQQEE